MAFRQAEPDDIRPLAELWDRAFPGERSADERARALETEDEPYGGLESAWVEERDGRIAGAFKAYRMTEYIGGAPLSMLGLAAVAVAPSARRRGLGRELCRRALRIGRERGDVVSLLYPFHPAFYRSLGWGTVGELRAFRFRPDALDEHPERDAVRAAGPADRDGLAACYADVAARSNGPIQRSPAAWRAHLEQPHTHAFLVPGDEGVRGYLLARFGAGPAPGKRMLYIPELVAADDVAYRALHGWIAAQRGAWPRVRYDARADEDLLHRLSDPRPPGFRNDRGLWYPTCRVLRGPMLRILDVPAALRARPRWGDEPGIALTLEIEVDDPELPENHGPWHLAIHEAGARVHEAEADSADARLATDAPTFAQIYAGELSATRAARLGRARIDGPAETLDDAFRLPERFWILDAF